MKTVEERRAYLREWAHKNKDKIRAYAKKQYAIRGDKIRARGHEYWQKPETKARENQRYYRRTPELEAKRKLRKLWQESPRSRRRFYRHSKYITYEDYERILPQLEAGGPCDCCGRMNIKTHIDHDHQTLKLRGVLCEACNKGLGHFADDIERIKQVINYLERTTVNISTL